MQKKWQKLIKEIRRTYDKKILLSPLQAEEHLEVVNSELDNLNNDLKLKVNNVGQKPVCSYLP